MIRRLESIDSKIRPGESVSVKRLTKAFEEMRGGRAGGSRDGRDRGGRDEDRNRDSDDSTEVELLVPGFGAEEPVTPLLGFGPSAELPQIPVIDADRRQAQDVLKRYDRNKDGLIDRDELKRGPFWGNPMDFDRNGDNKLSADELATRQSVRRGRDESKRSDRDRDRDDRRRRERDEPDEVALEDFQGRKSYRVYAPPAVEGMPRFFEERDLDGDSQISMSEYTSDWTDARVAEFYKWDANFDGIITATEVQSGVNNGFVASDSHRVCDLKRTQSRLVHLARCNSPTRHL